MSATAQEQSERDIVLDRLLASHGTWFDVYRDYEFQGRTFPGYAEFHSHGEQYVLVKRAKLWEVDAHEYLFFHAAEHLDCAQLADLVSFMTEQAIQKVDPQPNHMTSYLSLVIVANEVDDEAKRQVKKTKFRRNFALGIRGWADLRLAAIDLSNKSVTTNSQGKEMLATLRANLEPPRDQRA
ncbi:MAG: hypothetical protein Q4D27_07780 [Coriobacteriia bacterium]|nr:hypothetical protein [Coriobacteriia bacterium]